jgi:excisionase family DNA binding protein
MIAASSVPLAPPAQALLLNFADASPILGLSVWQIRGLVASGELPVVKVGRKLYVRRAALLRWAERAEGRHRT